MGFCYWQYPDFVNPYQHDKIGSTGEAEPRYINAVMGTEMTFLDGIEFGRKMWNFDQAIWTLQGRHRDQVKFADYIYEGPKAIQAGTARHLVQCFFDGVWKYTNGSVPTRKIGRDFFEDFKTRFYKLEGWDPDSGFPTRNTLEHLGLKDVADELERKGKLGKDAI